MIVCIDMDYIRGHLRYGHLEGNIDFSEEEEKDFKDLLKRKFHKEDLTEEELDRLDGYKEWIRDECCVVVDDWAIDDCGEYHWEDLLDG